jgi:hypothetical protein
MKIALIETTPSRPLYAIDAHIRNTMYVAASLKADVFFGPDDYAKHAGKKYDVLILMYGSFYAPVDLIVSFMKKNPDARLFWFTNEYNIGVNSFFMNDGRKFDVITNCEACSVKKNVGAVHTLNLNLLFAREPNPPAPKKYDCVYYGTFRPDRAEYFREYLQKPLYVSTSSKNFKKYKDSGCNPVFIEKLQWVKGQETLNHFRYSLYIEDKYTHANFNNLANRWYEAGFCNNVVFFDENCIATIRKSEIAPFIDEIRPYFVHDRASLLANIDRCNKDFPKHLAIQQKWHVANLANREKMLEHLRLIVSRGTI